jgi:hypothetical protein
MIPLRRHISDDAVDALNEWVFCNVRSADETDFREFMRRLHFIVDEEVRRAVERQRAESSRLNSRPSDNWRKSYRPFFSS